MTDFDQIVVKPSKTATNLDISSIELELIKIPQLEDEKQPEEVLRKSFKVSDFGKGIERLDVKELSEGQKYRVRVYYQHSFESIKSEICDWKEFQTKTKKSRQLQLV